MVNGVKVYSYEEAKELNADFLVTFADQEVASEILDMIRDDGLQAYTFDEFYKLLEEDQAVFLREWCAYHHAKHNDVWFEDAEKREAVDVFWSQESPFYQYFKELNLNNVIELACGHGRHVPHYIDKAVQITLVDILEENMEICRQRFSDSNNIKYYKNNGFNMEELQSDSYTALFSYDSMVHFEMMDIYQYLHDIYRVLQTGGKALLHHSNYTADYKVDFMHAPHARCFMSKDIFAYFANRTGFKIIGQQVIDWYGESGLDCITLLEK